LQNNKEVVLESTGSEMTINGKTIREVLGKDRASLLSATYQNKNRPVKKLLSKTSIPPEEDFKTSLPLRVLFTGQAIKESIELLNVLNNFDRCKLALLADNKNYSHSIVCGLIEIETIVSMENNGISIICRSKQDGKLIGERTLEFSIFECGLPLRDFL
jgi:hypothetical protein